MRVASLAGLCVPETGPTEDRDRARTRSSGEFREVEGFVCLSRGMVVIAGPQAAEAPPNMCHPGPFAAGAKPGTHRKQGCLDHPETKQEALQGDGGSPSHLRFVARRGSDSTRFRRWFIRVRAATVACGSPGVDASVGRNAFDTPFSGCFRRFQGGSRAMTAKGRTAKRAARPSLSFDSSPPQAED